MMLNSDGALALPDRPRALPSETVVVETRFGAYEFTPAQTVVMPHGLIGFADHQVFGLANLPAPVPEAFQHLQPPGPPPIPFVVIPPLRLAAPV